MIYLDFSDLFGVLNIKINNVLYCYLMLFDMIIFLQNKWHPTTQIDRKK